MTPGRSLVFGVMEICMCVLRRQLPNLLPSSASNQQPVLLVAIGSGFKCKPDYFLTVVRDRAPLYTHQFVPVNAFESLVSRPSRQ